jgi:transcription elongation factor Elf1
MKMPIVPNNPLSFTCSVCGTPVVSIGTALPAPLGGAKSCKSCHASVCAKHYDAAKGTCTECATQGDWCGTPSMPKL